MLKAALAQLFSAKTLTLWIILAMVAFVAFLIVAAVAVLYKVDLQGYFQDLLAFLGVSGGGGTARNVISDGIMPRVPMAIGARSDPSVAIQSPAPMMAPTTNYAAPPQAPKGPQS